MARHMRFSPNDLRINFRHPNKKEVLNNIGLLVGVNVLLLLSKNEKLTRENGSRRMMPLFNEF